MIRALVMAAALLGLAATDALAQDRPAEKPKSLWDEVNLLAYIENSFVGNLRGAGRDNVNELRYYDVKAGYTFNMAELKISKDPTEARPWGFGLAVTGGEDARKNHALGIFQGDDDVFPFKDTPPIDLQEAYGVYRFPLGDGLTVKAGKFASLIGFEVMEAPLNLNFSRSFLFTFAQPLTHVGALVSYAFGDAFTITAGTVVGWDVARDNNQSMSVMGQFASTPAKDLTLAFNWITGPEQSGKTRPIRTLFDVVATYTGFKDTVVGLNVDYGWEIRDASLVNADLASTTARWWGVAVYGAHDWTDRFRTSLRAEYFEDGDSARTLARAPGEKTALWDVTATVRYKIWKGLVARVEYRHDQANEKVFKANLFGPTSRAQDTISLDLIYQFF